mmetsp:Transcript_7419/g.20831  ORF Transcript_7419/g.20831 Transcript_7419/m.20831 type:complete len:194 (+) Transcript_7419:232-813(+)
MKPDWDRLGDAWKDSPTVLVADVDCTSTEGKPVCEANYVEGYPTMKYFTDQTGKDGSVYRGGRSFDDLDIFVEAVLDKECEARSREACSDREAAYVDEFRGRDSRALADEAERLQVLLSELAADSGEPRGWILRKLGLLEQLRGLRRRRRRTWDRPDIAVASAAAGVSSGLLVFAGFWLYERRRVGRGAGKSE